MRYSTEPRKKNMLKEMDFVICYRKFGDKYGKKLINTATETEIDAAKTSSKRIVQKTAEALIQETWLVIK